MPLVAMLAPRRAADMVSSLVAAAQESGALPKWSQANSHTHTMVGDPADLLIAGAYAFGARSFDARAALAAMVKGATEYGKATSAPDYYQRQGLPDYLAKGYVPYERNADSIASVFAPSRCGAWPRRRSSTRSPTTASRNWPARAATRAWRTRSRSAQVTGATSSTPPADT